MAVSPENVIGTPPVQLVLVWVLIFTLSYASLLKTKILGDSQKMIGIVSAVFAFFVVGFGSLVLGQFFTTLFGFSAFILAGILVAILFIAMSGGDVVKVLGTKWVSAFMGIIAIVIFLAASGLMSRGISSDIVSAIFVVVVLGIAVVFITGK